MHSTSVQNPPEAEAFKHLAANNRKYSGTGKVVMSSDTESVEQVRSRQGSNSLVEETLLKSRESPQNKITEGIRKEARLAKFRKIYSDNYDHIQASRSPLG